METVGITISILGAFSLVAAVAGGLKFAEVDFPVLTSRVLRGILAIVGTLLLVLGLLMLLVSMPLAPGPAQNPSAADSTDAEGSDQSLEYVDAANAACADAQSALPSEWNSPNLSPDESVSMVFQAGQIWSDLAYALNVLEPPTGAASDHSSLVSHATSVSAAVDNAEVALYNGDQTEFEAQILNAQSAATEFGNNASEWGLTACTRFAGT